MRTGALQRLFIRKFSDLAMSRDFLIPYTCPKFAEQLKFKPRYRVKLANPDTPIHEWNLPGIPKDFRISIKRDDMTGSTLSGNKVRKLEFLLAEALDKGCKHVITCGGIQSNHCRATAVAARQLGLQPHLLLRSEVKSIEEVGCEGNLLLDKLCDAKIYMVPRKSPYETELKPRMEKLASKIKYLQLYENMIKWCPINRVDVACFVFKRVAEDKHRKAETGESSLLIPVGGSDEIGLFGYINVFQEMISQGLLDNFDDIVFACGSGGTAEGLCIANYLTGQKLKIHGIIVSDDKKYFHDHVNKILVQMDLKVSSPEILHLIDGYKGTGYGISTQEEIDFIIRVGNITGIMLDPVYTGKAVRGLVQELNNNPQIFQGQRILFLHTGGIFGLYDNRINSTLELQDKQIKRIQMWQSKEDNPS